jgi:hypothetical protein
MWKNIKDKLPFVLTGIIVIIIFFAFAWGERFDLTKKINSDKIGDLGTTVGAVLTSLTVYLLYRQIVQMVQDKKATQLPQLYVAGGVFRTEDKITDYGGHKKTEPIFKHLNTDKNFSIEVHNIGLGVAKDIDVKWWYDDKAVAKFLGDDYGQNLLKSTFFVLEWSFLAAKGKQEINLPHYYMHCYGRSIKHRKVFPPLLKLQLYYSDIFNNRHTSSFEARIDSTSFEGVFIISFTPGKI